MNDTILEQLLEAVDQQVVSPQTPYVAATLTRLLGLGLAEKSAKTQIAECLGDEMERMLAERRAFDEALYRTDLDRLPDSAFR